MQQALAGGAMELTRLRPAGLTWLADADISPKDIVCLAKASLGEWDIDRNNAPPTQRLCDTCLGDVIRVCGGLVALVRL